MLDGESSINQSRKCHIPKFQLYCIDILLGYSTGNVNRYLSGMRADSLVYTLYLFIWGCLQSILYTILYIYVYRLYSLKLSVNNIFVSSILYIAID